MILPSSACRWGRSVAVAAALLLGAWAGPLPAAEYVNRTFNGPAGVVSTISDPNLIFTGCTISGAAGQVSCIADNGGTLTVNPSSVVTGSVVLVANASAAEDPGFTDPGVGGGVGAPLAPSALMTYVGSDLWLETDPKVVQADQIAVTTTSDGRFTGYFKRKGVPIGVVPLYDTVTGAHYAWAIKGWNLIDDEHWATLNVTANNSPPQSVVMETPSPLWWVLRVGNSSWVGRDHPLSSYPSQGCPYVADKGILGKTIRIVRKGNGTVVLVDAMDYALFQTGFPVASSIRLISGYSGSSSSHFARQPWSRTDAIAKSISALAPARGMSANPALNLPFGSEAVFENGVLRMADTVDLSETQCTDCDTGESFSVNAKRTGYYMPSAGSAAFIEHVEHRACFVAGTLVTTKRGLIPIEQVRKGDQVLARHVSSGTDGYQTVLTTGKRTAANLVDVTINGETIRATSEHPFLVGSTWIEASDLAPGMLVQVANGTGAKPVQSVKKVTGKATVHSLTIDQWEVYTVGRGAFVVHNSCVVVNKSFDPAKATMKIEVKSTCGTISTKQKLGAETKTLKIEPTLAGAFTVEANLITGRTVITLDSPEIAVGLKVSGDVTIAGRKATVEIEGNATHNLVTQKTAVMGQVAAQTKMKALGAEVVLVGMSVGGGATFANGDPSTPFKVDSVGVKVGATVLGVTSDTHITNKDGFTNKLSAKVKRDGAETKYDLSATRDLMVMKFLDWVMPSSGITSPSDLSKLRNTVGTKAVQSPYALSGTYYSSTSGSGLGSSSSTGNGLNVVASQPWTATGSANYSLAPSSSGWGVKTGD